MKRLFVYIFTFLSFNLFSQNFWQSVREDNYVLNLRDNDRDILPQKYSVFKLDIDNIQRYLSKAPKQFNRSNKSIEISIPMPDGTLMDFDVVYSPVMETELASKYPMIRSYKGVSKSDSRINIRFNIGIHGFWASIHWSGNNIYIDPYSDTSENYYMSYFTRDYLIDYDNYNLRCGVDSSMIVDNDPKIDREKLAGYLENRSQENCVPVKQYNYRLALACTGEWGAKHGGTKEAALSDMVTSVNRINQIYENEFAIHLNLIANNDKLIWLDKDTDPFDVSNRGGTLLGVINQIIIDNVGYNAFDIGHIFTNSCTDVGGIAMLSGVCNTSIKGSGVSCHYSNDLNYIITNVTAHEMGHQFSAVHTFNFCDGQNESDAGYEPGGGTSIMAYCGLCGGGNNVQTPCLETFHAYSIFQIYGFSRDGGGSGCAVKVETDNTAPIVELKYKNGFYIPKSSYFVLAGQAEDCENDQLTYSWEELDLGPLTTPGFPQYDSPIFSALAPSSSPVRYFPSLKTIIYNSFNNSEVVPEYGRNMNFRFIARDNHPGAGGTAWADMNFKVDSTSGPFTVESHGSGKEFYNNEPIEVNWNVANTDNDIVNCQYVDIYLSLDNGYTFPHLIAYRTPNDGSETVYLPDTTTNLAKFMVKGNDNIFFGLEKYNFKLLKPIDTTFNINFNNISGKLCIPDQMSTLVKTKAYNGYSDSIKFEIVGLPENTAYSFEPVSIMAGENSFLTFNFDNVVEAGNFSPYILAISNSGDTLKRVFNWDITNNNFKLTKIYSPVPGSDKNVTNPEFKWGKNDNAETFDFYLSKNPSFPTDETFSKLNLTDSILNPNIVLDYSTIYYWKIVNHNECGEFESDTLYTFITTASQCNTYNSFDIPSPINDNNPCISELVVEEDQAINDVNVTMKGSHQSFRELKASLVSPDATESLLFNNKSTTYQGGFALTFDDEATDNLKTKPNGTFIPDSPLKIFNNKNSKGTWMLKIIDNKDQLSGTLTAFELFICSSVDPNTLSITNNNLLKIPYNSVTPINKEYLKVEDDGNTPPYLLIYTLINLPKNSDIYLGSKKLEIGDQFSQSDIELGYVIIKSYTEISNPDYFTFTVTDGNGGWIDQTRFYFQPDKALEVDEQNFEYQVLVYPNPVNDFLNIDIQVDGSFNMQLLDLNGRSIYTDKIEGFGSNYINTSGFNPGLYILRIFNDKFNYNSKIILQN